LGGETLKRGESRGGGGARVGAGPFIQKQYEGGNVERLAKGVKKRGESSKKSRPKKKKEKAWRTRKQGGKPCGFLIADPRCVQTISLYKQKTYIRKGGVKKKKKIEKERGKSPCRGEH